MKKGGGQLRHSQVLRWLEGSAALSGVARVWKA